MKALLFSTVLLLAANAVALTREESVLVVDEFIKHASPLVREALPDFKRDLKVKIDWEADFPEANPGRITWPLLKLPYMTADAATFVLCHEIGHAEDITKHYVGNLNFSGAEIMADYFAASFCLAKLLQASPALSSFPSSSAGIELSERIRHRCQTERSTNTSEESCVRQVRAAIVLGEFLYREVYESDYRTRELKKPSLERSWAGEKDFLQCRLLNMENAIFHQPPFTCKDVP